MAERGARTAQPLNTGSFTLGVNLPWLVYGCDFGANAWFPEGGAGRADLRARANAVFARLAAAGLRTVRWFLFCDGRSGVRFDAAGRPLGVDDVAWRDLEAALEVASVHGVSLIFVLFDYPWCRRRRVVGGVALGGHRRTIARAGARSRLLEHVVTAILRRYGREPGIAAWDLFNEPEWLTLGYGGLPSAGTVLPAAMRAFFREACAAAHASASQPITVGLASARGLPLVRGCGLDLYQVHWYDRRERGAPLARPPLEKLDRPLLLGEFPSAGSSRPVSQLIGTARASGYSGALAWSATALDGFSDLDAIERAATRRG